MRDLENPADDPRNAAGDDESGDVARRRDEARDIQAPHLCGAARGPKERGRGRGSERDVEPVEGQPQPVSSGFDIRFLARPAVIKRLDPSPGRQRNQHRGLGGREKARAEAHYVPIRADLLEVDAHASAYRHREQRQIAGAPRGHYETVEIDAEAPGYEPPSDERVMIPGKRMFTR